MWTLFEVSMGRIDKYILLGVPLSILGLVPCYKTLTYDMLLLLFYLWNLLGPFLVGFHQ